MQHRDRIGDLEVLTHALESSEAIDATRYDVVVMLQPTSPLRRPAHVEGLTQLGRQRLPGALVLAADPPAAGLGADHSRPPAAPDLRRR